MRKWIDANGKKMDSAEFARFIRGSSVNDVEKMVNDVMEAEQHNADKLKRA